MQQVETIQNSHIPATKVSGKDHTTTLQREYVPEKTDKIVECATMLGYMSPLLCVSTWVSGIENAQIYKWGIIILVHILGIGIPVLVKKKVEYTCVLLKMSYYQFLIIGQTMIGY